MGVPVQCQVDDRVTGRLLGHLRGDPVAVQPGDERVTQGVEVHLSLACLHRHLCRLKIGPDHLRHPIQIRPQGLPSGPRGKPGLDDRLEQSLT